MTFIPQNIFERSAVGGNNIYSNAQNDFTATPTSGSKIITVTGLPFTLEAKHVINGSIKEISSAGAISAVKLSNVTVSSGVVTLSGATNFGSGSSVLMTITGPNKGYDVNLDISKTIEQSPLWAYYIEESLVDTTNINSGSNYYPSSTGATIAGYKNLSLTGKFIDADGIMSMSLECTNDEDTTNADWVKTYGYNTKNNTTINELYVSASTLTFSLDFNEFNFSSYRVYVSGSGATNTAIIKSRKTY